jgi:hypothetical protein
LEHPHRATPELILVDDSVHASNSVLEGAQSMRGTLKATVLRLMTLLGVISLLFSLAITAIPVARAVEPANNAFYST